MNATSHSSTVSRQTEGGGGDGSQDGPSPSTSTAARTRRAQPSESGAAGAAGAADDGDVPPEPEPPGRPIIEILCDDALIARHALDIAWLSDHIAQAATFIHTSLQQGEFIHIGVSIVDDERMAALHRDHCRLDSTTDVLTFPLSEPGTPLEVDLAVCGDEAARRAEEFGHSIERELLLYVVHGLLHCCGYDDHTEADFAAMHETEDTVLEAIGVGATFVKRENARISQRRPGEGLE